MIDDIPTLEELNKLFKTNLNENYYNDLLIMYEQKLSCDKCKSLDKCPFIIKGLRKAFDGKYFYDSECKYKRLSKLKFTQNKKISTFYLPQNVLDATLDSYDIQDQSRAKVVKFITEFIQKIENHEYKKGLYLYGTFSTGKTYTLSMIANELAKKNITSTIVYFPDLVANFKSLLDKTEEYDRLFENLKNVDVLLLDDLGAENMSSWVRDEIFGPIVNYRLMEKKPIFITSNLNPGDELKIHLACDRTKDNVKKADRILARLLGLVEVIQLTNSPYAR